MAWIAHAVPVSAVAPFFYLDATVDGAGAWAPVIVACPVVAGVTYSPDGSALTPAEVAARAALVPAFDLPAALFAPGVGAPAAIAGGYLYPTTALPPPFAAGAALGAAPPVIAAAPQPPVGGVGGIAYAAPSVVGPAPGPVPPGPVPPGPVPPGPVPPGPVPPGPVPPAGVVLPRVVETGLGMLALGYPDALVPSFYLDDAHGFRSYARDAYMTKGQVVEHLNELSELLGEAAENAGAPGGYVATIPEIRYFLVQVLYYFACMSTSTKSSHNDVVNAIGNGVRLEINSRQISGGIEEMRKFCRCYGLFAYKNFNKFGLEVPWALKHGLNNPYLADYMEADVMPQTVRKDIAVGKARALAKTSADAQVNVDSEVQDNFHETVVRNPRLHKTFRNAGFDN